MQNSFLPTVLRRHMKSLKKKYYEAKVKVREATSNNSCELTYNAVSLNEIMDMASSIWHC
uniref:Uncharacterized protein n=1 Tax=Bubo bubo TaxID=30461 RepID=A0A8C0F4A3_BUBBB